MSPDWEEIEIVRALLAECIAVMPPRLRNKVLKEYRRRRDGMKNSNAPGHAEWYPRHARALQIAEEHMAKTYDPDGYETLDDMGIRP